MSDCLIQAKQELVLPTAATTFPKNLISPITVRANTPIPQLPPPPPPPALAVRPRVNGICSRPCIVLSSKLAT